MKIKLPLKEVTIDAKIEDFEEKSEVYVFADEEELLLSKEQNRHMDRDTIFSLFINCGKDKTNAIMWCVEIDELEEFAYSILKKIEIVRRNYSEQIKFQTDRGNKV
jgi:hypothetical protein